MDKFSFYSFVSSIAGSLLNYWPLLRDFFNSSFTTSLVGSLAGAFAGAWGAQHIAERAKHRTQLLAEIRNINVAQSLTYILTSTFISMKQQHIKRMKEKFDADKLAVITFRNKGNLGIDLPNTTLHLETDFQFLTSPPLPVDILTKEIFEKFSASSKIRITAITLIQTISKWELSLSNRNDLIDKFRNEDAYKRNLIPLYFGLPLPGGDVDTTHSDTIENIYTQTDDGIFFSRLLAKELHNLGLKTAKLFEANYGKGAPIIEDASYDDAEKNNLLPNEARYRDWINAFVAQE